LIGEEDGGGAVDWENVDQIMDSGEETRQKFKDGTLFDKSQLAEVKKIMKSRGLTNDDVLLVNQYTGNYKYLNAALRDPRDNWKQPIVEKTRDRLNIGLDKLESHVGTVHRVMKGDVADFSNHVVGKEIKFNAFLSTSLNREISTRTGNITYEIKSKRGKAIRSLSKFKEENEILFRAGSRFRITGKTTSGLDGIHFRMEEI
jgi:hypothetical protein